MKRILDWVPFVSWIPILGHVVLTAYKTVRP